MAENNIPQWEELQPELQPKAERKFRQMGIDAPGKVYLRLHEAYEYYTERYGARHPEQFAALLHNRPKLLNSIVWKAIQLQKSADNQDRREAPLKSPMKIDANGKENSLSAQELLEFKQLEIPVAFNDLHLGSRTIDPETSCIQRSLVYEALSKIKKPRRRALIWLFWQGFTSEEVTLLLGITNEATRKLIERTVKQIVEVLY